MEMYLTEELLRFIFVIITFFSLLFSFYVCVFSFVCVAIMIMQLGFTSKRRKRHCMLAIVKSGVVFSAQQVNSLSDKEFQELTNYNTKKNYENAVALKATNANANIKLNEEAEKWSAVQDENYCDFTSSNFSTTSHMGKKVCFV
ncbi:hypothetical protein PACTADRAFT_18384 [Pachysolen tannophilus NRRL Y-2460]|uniref:Uncharacterized protein n=1 Tax=Pachysolen tannophilus NRRL Y-2460 TaxID=669874 RepID=A0A1E4TPS6_PACTA|nr:hypothetical protein PACTADRAFT_18384 [Pachysolen tannophilus NRRL Y-2460]